MEDTCWKNYEMLGTKKKNGKKVPNCVKRETSNDDNQMLIGTIEDIVQYAKKLKSLVDEKTEMDEWMESKLTVARTYLSDVTHAFMNELKSSDKSTTESTESYKGPFSRWLETKKIPFDGYDPKKNHPEGGLKPSYAKKLGIHAGIETKQEAERKGGVDNMSEKTKARRKSFCARMKGMKEKNTSSEVANDPNSKINASLRVWKC